MPLLFLLLLFCDAPPETDKIYRMQSISSLQITNELQKEIKVSQPLTVALVSTTTEMETLI